MSDGTSNVILVSGTETVTIPSGSAFASSGNISYAYAGFSNQPEVVACVTENTLRTVGVVSRTASQVVFQVRNTAGNVGANTTVTFCWIATGT